MNIKSKKGFTLVEIVAAALIISIASAGTFSAYVLARKFSNRFKYKSEATKIAASVADELRYRSSYGDDGVDDALEVLATWHDIPAVDLDKYNLKAEVNNTLTAQYLVSRAWFVDDGLGNISETPDDPGSDGDPDTREIGLAAPYLTKIVPPYFKKITVKVGWTEPA